MKKLIIGMLTLSILLGANVANAATTPTTYQGVFTVGNGNYSINGVVKKDIAPYIKNGRMFMPLRYVAYANGIGDNSIYWDDKAKIAYLEKGKDLVAVPVGTPYILKNGVKVTVDAPAEMVQGRVMLPLRVVSQAFNCQVDWVGSKK